MRTMMVSHEHSMFVVILIFIQFRCTRCLLQCDVVRHVNGDRLFCPCNSQSKRPECSGGELFNLSLINYDQQASCEGRFCCGCRCSNADKRPNYIRDKIRNKSACVGNAALPHELRMNTFACKWRLVARRKDGKSCQKEDVPVVGLNNPGRQDLDLCTFHQENALDLNYITSCNVVGRARYYNNGQWNESQATFVIRKNKKSLLIEWNKHDGVDAVGYIISMSVSCSLKKPKTNPVTACLIVKSTESNTKPSPKTKSVQPALTAMKPTSGDVQKSAKITETTEEATSTYAPTSSLKSATPKATTTKTRTSKQLNTATNPRTEKISSKPKESRTFSQSSSTTQSLFAENKTNAKPNTFVTPAISTGSFSVDQTLPTELKVERAQKNSNGSFYVTLSIGCSIFVLCASMLCVSVILLRRRKRRKKLRKLSKGNPLYDEGAKIGVILTNDLNEINKESKDFYQPLVQNSRPKHGNKNPVYQALRKKGRSIDDMKEHSDTPPKSPQYQSLQRKKDSHENSSNGYQALSYRKEMDRNKLIDDDYSTPDSYKEAIAPVNKRLLRGNFEPECVSLGKETGKCDRSSESSHLPECFGCERPRHQMLEMKARGTSQETNEPNSTYTDETPTPDYNELESPPLYYELERV